MNAPRLTLRQLQIFVAVARSGSTIAAAAQVALSQSATSAAINELERLLSQRLFDRVGRRLQLNENGRALFPRALVLLDGANGIEKSRHDDCARLQELRIGASTTIASYMLPQTLQRYLGGICMRGDLPWQSSVSIGNVVSICRQVADFELDVGLVEGTCSDPALRLTPWLRDEMVVVAAPQALRKLLATEGRPRLSSETLRRLLWLLRETGSGTRQAADQMLLPQLKAYHRSIEMASSEAIKRSAAAGIGVACLSRRVVQDLLEAGSLALVPSTLPRLFRQCFVVSHVSKQSTPAMEYFLRVTRDEAREARATRRRRDLA